MKSKFYKCLEEILSTTSVGVGSTKTEPSVNPTNDDFYARGDARIPMGVKKKRKKKRHIKESAFSYPLTFEQSFKILRERFKEKGYDFKHVTSIMLKDTKPITIKAQIVTDILNKSNMLKGKPDKENTHNLKNIMSSIDPHRNSGRILVIGSFIKDGKIGVTWTLV